MDRLRESELIHCRWAMAGVAGCLFVELLGFGNWFDAPLWAVNGGTATYFGVPVPVDVRTIVLVELIAMAGVEILRNEQSDAKKRQYPGALAPPVGGLLGTQRSRVAYNRRPPSASRRPPARHRLRLLLLDIGSFWYRASCSSPLVPASLEPANAG